MSGGETGTYLGEDAKNPVCRPASHSPLQALSFCILHSSPAGCPEQTLSHLALGPLLWWSFHLVSPSYPFCTYQNLSYSQGLSQSSIFLITILISLSLCSSLRFPVPLKVLWVPYLSTTLTIIWVPLQFSCGFVSSLRRKQGNAKHRHKSRPRWMCHLSAWALEWLVGNQNFFIALFLYHNLRNFLTVIVS